MTSDPVLYNNCAGRLFHALRSVSAALARNVNNPQKVDFAKFLGIDDNWDAILLFISDLKQELYALEEVVASIRDQN